MYETARLFTAMENVDIVVHAAALKQVTPLNIILWKPLKQAFTALKMLLSHH